jgi:hypothetical protein
MSRWKDRPTAELLVLMIAGTICSGLAFTGLASVVFAFVNPDQDLAAPARYIADITNTLIGLLAGFLAGTTTTFIFRRSEVGGEDDGHYQYEGQQTESEEEPQHDQGQEQ